MPGPEPGPPAAAWTARPKRRLTVADSVGPSPLRRQVTRVGRCTPAAGGRWGLRAGWSFAHNGEAPPLQRRRAATPTAGRSNSERKIQFQKISLNVLSCTKIVEKFLQNAAVCSTTTVRELHTRIKQNETLRLRITKRRFNTWYQSVSRSCSWQFHMDDFEGLSEDQAREGPATARLWSKLPSNCI